MRRNSNEFKDVLDISKFKSDKSDDKHISLCLFVDSTPLVKSKNLQ